MRAMKKKSPAMTLIPAIKCCLSNSYDFFKNTELPLACDRTPLPCITSLFQSQYNELFEANDVIAEHLRALNEFAPATLSEFKADSMIKEGVSSDGWRDMVKVLFSDMSS